MRSAFCWCLFQDGAASSQIRTTRIQVKLVRRAVRDLPPDEVYAQWEIEEKKSEKFHGSCEVVAGIGTALAGAGAVWPVVAGTAMAVDGGYRVQNAQKDVTKMEKHNDQSRQRKACKERDKFTSDTLER